MAKFNVIFMKTMKTRDMMRIETFTIIEKIFDVNRIF
jgi:hypothetical protein